MNHERLIPSGVREWTSNQVTTLRELDSGHLKTGVQQNASHPGRH